jgi:hypothetical protein
MHLNGPYVNRPHNPWDRWGDLAGSRHRCARRELWLANFAERHCDTPSDDPVMCRRAFPNNL